MVLPEVRAAESLGPEEPSLNSGHSTECDIEGKTEDTAMRNTTVVSGLIQDLVNSRIRIFEVGECRG